MPNFYSILPVIISIISLLFVSYNIVATNYRASKQIKDANLTQNNKISYDLEIIKERTQEVKDDVSGIRKDSLVDRERLLTLEKDVVNMKEDISDIKEKIK